MTQPPPRPAPPRRCRLAGLLAVAAALPAYAAPAPPPPAVMAPVPAAPARVRKDGLEIVALPPDGAVTRADIATGHYRIYLERYEPENAGRLLEAAYRAWAVFFGKEPPAARTASPSG